MAIFATPDAETGDWEEDRRRMRDAEELLSLEIPHVAWLEPHGCGEGWTGWRMSAIIHTGGLAAAPVVYGNDETFSGRPGDVYDDGSVIWAATGLPRNRSAANRVMAGYFAWWTREREIVREFVHRAEVAMNYTQESMDYAFGYFRCIAYAEAEGTSLPDMRHWQCGDDNVFVSVDTELWDHRRIPTNRGLANTRFAELWKREWGDADGSSMSTPSTRDGTE
jgi:hypothetical protein